MPLYGLLPVHSRVEMMIRLPACFCRRPEGRRTLANGILGEVLTASAELNIEVAVDICKLLKNRTGQPNQAANANYVRPIGAHADEKQTVRPAVPR